MSRQNYGFIYGSAGKRYPRYFRCLRELLMNGILKISSAELAERLGLTPSQVRTDLNGFGGAGQQGYGYNVKLLYTEISRELGVGDGMTAIVIGGDTALAGLLATRFEGRGVTVTGHFAVTSAAGAEETERLLAHLNALPTDIAVVIALPEGREDLPRELVARGIGGIWNLMQTDLVLPIPVLNLPIGDILSSLCCDIKKYRREGGVP